MRGRRTRGPAKSARSRGQWSSLPAPPPEARLAPPVEGRTEALEVGEDRKGPGRSPPCRGSSCSRAPGAGRPGRRRARPRGGARRARPRAGRSPEGRRRRPRRPGMPRARSSSPALVPSASAARRPTAAVQASGPGVTPSAISKAARTPRASTSEASRPSSPLRAKVPSSRTSSARGTRSTETAGCSRPRSSSGSPRRAGGRAADPLDVSRGFGPGHALADVEDVAPRHVLEEAPRAQLDEELEPQ